MKSLKAYFLYLYEYNTWANQRILGTLSLQQVMDEKILQIMGHVVAAQWLWLHRVMHLPPPALKLWGSYTLDELLPLHAEAAEKWLQYINSRDSFDEELSYTNYQGEPFTNNVQHIMIHLVNHATYHRGQVALLMRMKGYEPVNTDLITYDRIRTGQLSDT
jgi:uncharacterized damage-inducible protein DinB